MSDHDNDGNIGLNPVGRVPPSGEMVGYLVDWEPKPITALFCQTRSDGKYMSEFRVSHYDVRSEDADGYGILSTRDLPDTITAHELAQIIDMTLRLPNYVIKRDFPGVAHLFKPVEEA